MQSPSELVSGLGEDPGLPTLEPWSWLLRALQKPSAKFSANPPLFTTKIFNILYRDS